MSCYQDSIEYERTLLRNGILDLCKTKGHILFVTLTDIGDTIVCRRCRSKWGKTIDGRWINIHHSPLAMYLEQMIREGKIKYNDVYLSNDLIPVELK